MEHYSRYRKNGGKALPLNTREAKRRGLWVPPPPEQSEPGLTGHDIRLLARTLAARDPYPLETTSADVTLANPCSEEDTFRLRQRERGLVQVECAGCGGVAWQEPPVWVNGVERTVVRCVPCDTKKRKERLEMAVATLPKTKCKYCPAELPQEVLKNGAIRPRVTCGAEECKKAHQAWLLKNPRHKQPAIDPTAVLERANEDLEKWDAAPPPPATDAQRTCECGATFTPKVAKRCPPCREAWEREHAQTPEHNAARKAKLDAELEAARARNSEIPPAAIPHQPPQQHNPRIYEGVKSNPNADLILAAVLALEAVPYSKRAGVLALVDHRAAIVRAEVEAAQMLAELAS